MSKMNSSTNESLGIPDFSNQEIARLLRSAVRDFPEAIRIRDTGHQSETAGRLHALSVELRQLASDTETTDVDSAQFEAKQAQYMQ